MNAYSASSGAQQSKYGAMAKDREPITIKKYADRLYDTGAAGYVTLGNLADMIRDGEAVVIYDAKTRQDITRSVLNQIVVERA